MTKKLTPPPALFGEMPEQPRPTSTSTDSHTRTRCAECRGKGQVATKKRMAGVMTRTWADCVPCLGAGFILTRNCDA